MAVASSSSSFNSPRRGRSRKLAGESKRKSRTKQATAPSEAHSKVKSLPLRSQLLPPGIQFLLLLQKSTSVLAFALIAITLGVYAWTVYAPKLWSREYRKLDNLLRYERHLIATNETLKNQLAQQAERPETGLDNPHPSDNIFLKVTTSPPISLQKPSASTESPPLTHTPISY